MVAENKITYDIDISMSDVLENRCPILHALDVIGQK